MIKGKEYKIEFDVFADFRNAFSETEKAFENNENKVYFNKDDVERCECGVRVWYCKYPSCKAGR